LSGMWESEGDGGWMCGGVVGLGGGCHGWRVVGYGEMS